MEGLVEVPDDDDEADLPVLGGTAKASILGGREGNGVWSEEFEEIKQIKPVNMQIKNAGFHKRTVRCPKPIRSFIPKTFASNPSLHHVSFCPRISQCAATSPE